MPSGEYQRKKTVEALRFFESALSAMSEEDPELESQLQKLKGDMRVKMLKAVSRAIDILRWAQDGFWMDKEGVRHPIHITIPQIMAAKALVQFCPKPEQHSSPVTLMFEGIPRPKPKVLEAKVVDPALPPTSPPIVDPEVR